LGSDAKPGVLPQTSGVTREGGKGGHLPPGAAFWGRQIEVSMSSNNYEMSNVNGCN